MVKRHRVAGIVLTVLGILFLLGGLIVVVRGEAVYALPSWVSPLGIVMIVAGVYLYYIGYLDYLRSERQKRGV